MKVVFVELAHETGEVGVFKHSTKDICGEGGDVFDNEEISLRSPTHDPG